MKFGRWLIALTLLLFSISASAEYYKYIDKDGNVHYTDDLTAVPESQRTDINEYNEIQSSGVDRQKGEETVKSPDTSMEIKKTETKQGEFDFSEMKKQLDLKKEALNEEYKALMNQKKQFQEKKEQLKSRTAAMKYNKSVSEFNERLEDYQQRKKEFDAEVERYNDQVEQSYLKQIEERKQAKEQQ
jgi:DNA repair exonuclease SbcCD ATPase subunit